MAALNFPSSPTNGQKWTDPNGQTWVYESATNSWTAEGAPVPGMVYKGGVDITATAPTGALGGWVYTVTTGGTPHASFTGLTGNIPANTQIIFDGTNWQVQSPPGIWARTGTTLSPATTGDKLQLGGGAVDLDAGAATSPLVRDAKGRLLVGTSSSRSINGFQHVFQIEGTTLAGSSLSAMNNASDQNPPLLTLGKSKGGALGSFASVAADTGLGAIAFMGADGTGLLEAATIKCFVDGTPGTNDMPTRLVFSTTADGASSPTQRLVIKESGLCGFFNGTPTFSYHDTAGFQVSHTGAILTSVEAERCALFNRRTSDGIIVEFARNSAAVGSVSVTTTATTYNTSSDYRLKENVTPVTDGITRLQQLKPSRFNFIADPDKTVDGFLAHEVQTIVPEAITGEKDEIDDDGNPIYQGIDQSKLVPLLTAALQEAIGEIESLKARVAALESA